MVRLVTLFVKWPLVIEDVRLLPRLGSMISTAYSTAAIVGDIWLIVLAVLKTSRMIVDSKY